MDANFGDRTPGASNEQVQVLQTLKNPQYYYYQALSLAWVFTWVWFAFGPAVTFAGIDLFHRKGGPAIIMGLLLTWFNVNLVRFFYCQYRPITISDDCIVAHGFHGVWKSLNWSDVTKIERVRSIVYPFAGWGARYGYQILIYVPNKWIIIRDEIYQFHDLLEELEKQAKIHKIPLIACDKGRDTMLKIKAEVTDPQRRKRLLKEGVKTPLVALT